MASGRFARTAVLACAVLLLLLVVAAPAEAAAGRRDESGMQQEPLVVRRRRSSVPSVPAASVLPKATAATATDDADVPGVAVPLNVSSFGAGPVAFITAHPDDIEGAAGGLVSLLAAQGTAVFYIILTNGDKGCGNPAFCNASVSSEQIALWRAGEAVAAAGVLGVPASNVMLFGYEDAMLTSVSESQVRMRLTAALRTIKPVATFTWRPYPNFAMQPSKGWYDLGYHADHMASARLGIDAHSNAGTDRLWPELGPTWSIPQMYLFDFGMDSSAPPTHFVDITGKALQAKTAAFLAHKTQYPNTNFVGPFLTKVAAMVANATAIRPANVPYAEAFVAYF